jgi:pyroglutamyl-peptidase
MSEPLRILLTGFGPFPGAIITNHIFHVTYRTVDRELPELIAERRPHALLMFGLAGRTPHLRIETRARNAVTTTFPDADRTIARKGTIVPGAAAMPFGPHMARLLRAARTTGIDARPSRDAGSYLCNYLSWRAIEATRTAAGPRLAAFIHIPPLPRTGTALPQGSPRITLEALVDAGEAMLMELVKLTRQACHRTP